MGEFCELRIADYGRGIPDEVKPKIFDAGFSYGKTGNTGLDLHIAKMIVNRYGRMLWMEDNQPNGTVFIMKLRKPS